MNALELANWIENGAPFGKYETAKQAVVMLRQQQAEIESLKEKVMKNTYSEEKVDLCKEKLKPVAELVLEQMAVGDASSLRVHWLTNELPPVGTKLYTHPVKEQELLDEIQALKEVNTKQADYIAEQKSAYEKLWKEHMELFWKHEQDTDLTNE